MTFDRLRRLCAWFALSVAFSAPAWAGTVRLPCPGGSTLVLDAPDDWRSAGRPAKVPTLTLGPSSGAAFAVLVSTAPPGVGPDSPTAVRRAVEGAMAHAGSQAVEPTLTIKTLRSANVQGYYFSATDKAPAPGEFKFMTQGTLLVQGQAVFFTILSNDGAGDASAAALRMLGAARLE